jgi:hypothetical protein
VPAACKRKVCAERNASGIPVDFAYIRGLLLLENNKVCMVRMGTRLFVCNHLVSMCQAYTKTAELSGLNVRGGQRTSSCPDGPLPCPA